jgi:voltage-gated potassium channel
MQKNDDSRPTLGHPALTILGLALAPVIVAPALAVRFLWRLTSRKGVQFVVVLALAAVFIGGFVTYVFEEGGDGPIQSYGDGLWYAIQSITTVGYGDEVPVTTSGRAFGVLVLVVGIAVYTTITASAAALLVRDEVTDERIDLLLTKVDQLERLLTESRDRGPSP